MTVPDFSALPSEEARQAVARRSLEENRTLSDVECWEIFTRTDYRAIVAAVIAANAVHGQVLIRHSTHGVAFTYVSAADLLAALTGETP